MRCKGDQVQMPSRGRWLGTRPAALDSLKAGGAAGLGEADRPLLTASAWVRVDKATPPRASTCQLAHRGRLRLGLYFTAVRERGSCWVTLGGPNHGYGSARGLMGRFAPSPEIRIGPLNKKKILWFCEDALFRQIVIFLKKKRSGVCKKKGSCMFLRFINFNSFQQIYGVF